MLYIMLHSIFFYFFFSSRRRHTRSLCDWSSDVCSSDLEAWQVRMRRRTACQGVPGPLILVKLRAELGHRRTGGHAGCRQSGLQGFAADARVAVAECG